MTTSWSTPGNVVAPVDAPVDATVVTTVDATGSARSVRDRLVLALDADDLVEAVRLAVSLGEWFGVVKVGLELFSAAGPEAISTLRQAGFEVFVDLKLNDDPATVYRTARIFGAVGARYLSLHAHSGVPMLEAGVEGLAEGAASAGLPGCPIALAVTVLSSDTDPPPHIVPARIEAAVVAGCGGLVCAPRDLEVARRHGPGLLRVVPLDGGAAGGVEPAELLPGAVPVPAIGAALDAGADLVVVGRSITLAPSPGAVSAAVFQTLSDSAASGGQGR